MHRACSDGRIEIVRLLCDHGTDVNARNSSEWRPLHCAAMYGHMSIVKELIEERHAEINARDDDGWTALWFAKDANEFLTAAYLVASGGTF